MIPLFDWLAQRPKYFKNYVTKNPELFQDTPNLAEDFDSPICLAYTTDKMVTIFKNVIPCFWQRYSWKLIWSDLKKSWQSSFWSPSKRKGRNLHHVMLCFGHALLWPCHASPDKICTKDTNFQLYNWFPTFWRQKEEIYYSSITFHCHYSSVTVHDTVHSEFFPI